MLCYNSVAKPKVEGMQEPVRGMRDVSPQQQRWLARTRRELEHEIERWGFQLLDLPILEHHELYLKKAGEELVGKLYDFAFQGRHLTLRPEWTASVLRAYLHAMQSEPLPLRLAYSGPVFRYERPQRLTYRQFTQVGVELIGAGAPQADAEVVSLACRGLERAGVGAFELRIGHIGVVRALLSGLGLADRTANVLLWNLERLRDGEPDAIREKLAEIHGDELFDLGPLAALPDDQLERLLLTMLRAVGLRLENSTRPPEAIAARLVRKLRREDPQPRVERALELLACLAQTRGPPDQALPQLERLFDAENIDAQPIAELRAIGELLEPGLPPGAKIVVDGGLGRGLHYYSGLVFEITTPDGMQLCGGGRYDDLVSALGGRTPVPATGFAYGLERVAHAAQLAEPPAPTMVLVIGEQSEDGPAMLRTAEQLRRRGWIAISDVRGRSLQSNIKDAQRRGASAVAICNSRTPDTVRWYSIADRREQPIAVADIPAGDSG